MKVLILGGTGLISTGIVEHLLQRGVAVTLFNRGTRDGAPADVSRLVGDRDSADDLARCFATAHFDVVIDMICFSPSQAEASVRTFAGRTEQLIFCSTVCTYGVEISPRVLIDETFVARPTSDYARNKLACERIFLKAHTERAFQTTIIRPSHTYGPGGPLIDQLELDGAVWDRVAHGLPILCAGDGIGLWQATHRSDVGRLFAYACGNPATYGEAFNATGEDVLTWRDYYRKVAQALEQRAQLVMVPAGWVVAANPRRFAFLNEVSRYHGAYDSAKARAAVPEFRGHIDLTEGARETLADMRRRGAWRRHQDDEEYASLVERAIALGCERVVA